MLTGTALRAVATYPTIVQRYGPTERAVTLWGHEIACLWPFGDMKHDMKLLTFIAKCAVHTGSTYESKPNEPLNCHLLASRWPR